MLPTMGPLGCMWGWRCCHWSPHVPSWLLPTRLKPAGIGWWHGLEVPGSGPGFPSGHGTLSMGCLAAGQNHGERLLQLHADPPSPPLELDLPGHPSPLFGQTLSLEILRETPSLAEGGMWWAAMWG